MITDVFLYDDEEELLALRLAQLGSVVDRFVAIEGDRYMSSGERALKLTGRSDIEVIQVPMGDLSSVPHQAGPWVASGYSAHWQRDYLQRGAASSIEHAPDDVVIYGDIDEIPRREVISSFSGAPGVLMLTLLVYSIKSYSPNPWAGPVIGHAAELSTFPVVRNTRWSFRHIPDAGWHLTWFGGSEARRKKARVFAHGELSAKADDVADVYPWSHVGPDGEMRLDPYDGDVPEYLAQGRGPAVWRETYGA